MHLDCREYPVDYTFAEVAGEALGIYVNVADFTRIKERRIFRMIVDAELSRKQLAALLNSTVRDQDQTYQFHQLEAIMGPCVDQGARPSRVSQYLRITYM